MVNGAIVIVVVFQECVHSRHDITQHGFVELPRIHVVFQNVPNAFGNVEAV